MERRRYTLEGMIFRARIREWLAWLGLWFVVAATIAVLFRYAIQWAARAMA